MNIPAWLGPSWLGLAVLQLLQVSAVIVLVWIVTRLIGPRRPHLTHAIWLVALLKCLTPPLWASPSGAFSWIGIQEQTPAQIPATIEFAAEAARRDSLSEFRGDLTTTKPTASRETASHAIEWAHFLGAVWICGIVGMCVAVGVRAARLRRWVVRIASQTPDDVAELFSQLQARFGVRGKVKLVIVKANFGPAVFGLIRPTLVLPEELLRRDLELSPAIAHELAHLRRRDHWIGALQIAAVALWWFNPLVWWMNRQIEQARESSCDEEVIARLGCHRHEYAQMLLDIVRWRREAYWPALGVRAASVTERRLEHIVNGSQRLHRRTPALAWLMTAVMAAVLLPGAGLNRSLNAAAVAQLATPNATSSTQPAGPLHFSGQVRDKTTGKGIERATVTLHRENAREPEQWDPIGKPQLIQTDAQGRFEFSVTAAEAADSRFCLGIEVSHPRYASLMWEGEGLSLIFDEQKRGERPWFEDLEMAPAQEVSATVLNPDQGPAVNCPVKFMSLAGTEKTAGIQQGNNITMGDTTTDAKGRFRFLALKGSTLTAFSLYPEKFAATAIRVDPARGDQGTVQLKNGVSIGGKVIDEKGHPLVGVKVQASSEKKVLWPYGETERSAVTDANGGYLLQPMEPGDYRVAVEEDDRFLPAAVKLATEARMVVNFAPVAEDTIHVHFVDSAGKPSQLRNRIGVAAWREHPSLYFHTGFKGDGPEVDLRYPRGLEKVELLLMGMRSYTMLWRKGTDVPWREWTDTVMDAPTEDNAEITIIQYESPELTVRITDARGQSISKGRVQILYEDASLHYKNISWDHNVGDVGFDQQANGSWVSSEMMIPDKPFELRVDADGYKTVSQKLTMNEGEKKQIDVRLDKAAP